MAGQSIGTAALKLVADSTGLSTGLNKAKETIGSWGKDIAKGALGFLAADAIKGVLGGIVDGVKEQFEKIDSTAKLADRLGVTTEFLTGLQHTADLSGVSVEELEKNLDTLNKRLIDGAEDFTKWGIDSRALASSGLQEAVGIIADRVDGFSNASERAAFLADAFGKSGAKMAAALAGGNDALRTGARNADLYGQSFSRIGAANVEEMNDALTEAGMVVDGLKLQLAIGVAPIVTEIAKGFTDWVKEANGVKPIVQEIVRIIAIGAAAIFDVLVELKNGIKDMAALARAIKNPTIGDFTAVAVTPLLGIGGLFAGNKPPGGKTPGDLLFDKIMSGFDASPLAKTGGLSLGDRKAERAATETMKEAAKVAAKAAEEEKRRVDQILTQNRTPLEAFKAELAELDQLFAAGALTVAQQGRAVSSAFDKLASEDKAMPPKLAGALSFGSQEALSAVNRLMSSSTAAGKDPTEVLKRMREQDAKHNRELTKRLDDIKRALGTEQVVGSL